MKGDGLSAVVPRILALGGLYSSYKHSDYHEATVLKKYKLVQVDRP